MNRNLTIRHHLPVLAVSYLHSRGEFFTTSFCRIDNEGFMQQETLCSSDPVFGVRVPLPESLEAGQRYLFHFRCNPQMLEYILLGERVVYERMPLPNLLEIGISGPEASMTRKQSGVTIRAIAQEKNPLVTFVRDRARARWVETLQGKWRLSLQAEDEGRHCSEWCEVDDELKLHLRLDVHVEPLPPGPEDIRAAKSYHLPHGLRFWKGPEIFHKMPVDRAADIEPQPVQPVAWPTDEIMICENEDSYDETREPAYGSPSIAELEAHLDLCDRYGVNGFMIGNMWTVITDRPYIKRLVELFQTGKGKSIKYLILTFGGPPVELEMDESFTRQACNALHDLLSILPDRRAVVRVMEVPTNGQWPRPGTIPPYLFPEKIWDKDLYYIEHHIFPTEHRRYMEKIKAWIDYPDRTEIWFQSDGATASPHWYSVGIDYFTTKNIWGFNTNIVQALGRGFARAFGKPIGLAYDSHRSLDWEGVNPSDVEHVFRSYFYAGAEKTQYEAQFVGVDQTGRKVPTESGAVYYNWVCWAKRHPRRGKEIIRIGFIKGSDDYGLRNPTPGPTRHGYRKRLLLHNHPAYRDWNLLDMAYPKFGDYEGSNPYRFLTGTPYGQADVVPFNAPIEHLTTFDTLVMIGRNRLTAESFANYLAFVRGGGRLVLALEHLLDEQARLRKYADFPLEELIGARLGRDVNILPTVWQELVPSTTCFYNRVQPDAAEVLESMGNGDPLLLRHNLGKGEVYFYTSEFLTSVNEDSPRCLLKRLFAESRIVWLEPISDWIQYFIRCRKEIVMVGLINHGQAGFPQSYGPKSGPWLGRINVNYKALKLDPGATEAFILDEQMNLHPVQSFLKEEKLVINLELDVWCEVVIGPMGRTRALLFERGKSSDSETPG